MIAAAALGAWLLLAPTGPKPGTADAQAIYVDIAPGTSTRTIAGRLERAGVIRSRYAFDLLRAIKGGRLVAGEYRFNHPAAAAEVYGRIVQGDVYTIALTIPEGFNIFDIAQAVASAGLGSRDGFLSAERTRVSLIADLDPGASSLEGYLFPDTYRFPRTAAADTILAAMVKRFRQAVAQLYPAGVPNDGLAHTVVLASLIEKEVAVDTERPLVAGVFANRLARGMPLATDPSVIYAALLANRWRKIIYASDLQFDSPYNTYRHTGLPPGPICNPGLAALRAALHPAQTDYLYFVADAQGHSRFATTLAEHSRNVADYRKATGEVPQPPQSSKPAALPSHRKRYSHHR